MVQTTSTIGFWQQSQWAIAFISSVVTISLTLIVQGVAGYFKKRRSKKEMARNLSVEILTNKENNFRYLKSLKKIRDTFQIIKKLDGGGFSGYPSFIATGKESTTIFFDVYKEQLNLFDIKLMIDIYGFYKHHLSSVELGAKKLQASFEKFYSNNPMVGHNDVVVALDEHISNVEVLHKSGEEVIATLTFCDKKLREVPKEKKPIIKEALKKVNKYILDLKPDDTFSVDDLVNRIEVNGEKIHRIVLMVGIVTAMKKNFLQRVKAGEYKKVAKRRKNRDVPVF